MNSAFPERVKQGKCPSRNIEAKQEAVLGS